MVKQIKKTVLLCIVSSTAFSLSAHAQRQDSGAQGIGKLFCGLPPTPTAASGPDGTLRFHGGHSFCLGFSIGA